MRLKVPGYGQGFKKMLIYNGLLAIVAMIGCYLLFPAFYNQLVFRLFILKLPYVIPLFLSASLLGLSFLAIYKTQVKQAEENYKQRQGRYMGRDEFDPSNVRQHQAAALDTDYHT